MNKLASFFRLTGPEYFADFFITPPITAAMLIFSVWSGMSWIWLVQFAAGIIAWTLYEYGAHRWLLHRVWLFRDLHGMHHENQIDYIALHPVATLMLYGAFWFLFGFHAVALMVGFSVGYVVYSILHTAFHYARIGDGNPLFALKRHHALHHKFEDTNFGVTTTLWDSAFGTKIGLRSGYKE